MRHLTQLVALAALMGAGPVLAGNMATPEQVTVCAACHGADGKATAPIYPHLAGQYANYIEQALKEYRSGQRKNPIMGAQAAALTDADIRALAAYYSAQSTLLHTPSIHSAAPK